MKYIFTSASKKAPDFVLRHPNQLTIDLPKSPAGWVMAGDTYKTPESWLEGARRKLLLLDITDVQCASVPINNSPKLEHKFQFYFGSEFECYQFQTVILPDRKGVYKRDINAASPEKSLEQEINIRKFADKTELDAYIQRTSPTSFTVRTESSHDDLILGMNMARGKFDHHIVPNIEPITEKPKKAEWLLLGSKATEENVPKNAP